MNPGCPPDPATLEDENTFGSPHEESTSCKIVFRTTPIIRVHQRLNPPFFRSLLHARLVTLE
jgi:hypothetical protein